MASSSTILFLELPSKTFVGIDLLSFDSSPDFKGISEVPSGLHFVYTGTDASLSIRHGRWLNVESATRHVLQWDAKDESLSLVPADSADGHRAVAALETFSSRNLITYAALEAATANLQANDATAESTSSSSDSWLSLTNHISTATVNRIVPTGVLTSVSSAAADSDADRIPGLSRSEVLSSLPADSALSLVPINLKQTWAEGDIGSVRTERARDRSWYLGQIMDSMTDGVARQTAARELLGELQFCFLMVVILANWSCLEGWKRILGLVFTCRDALNEVEAWFVEVVKVLKAQLERVGDVEGGVFELREEAASGWLRELLRRFRGNVEDMLDEGSKLETELQGLEAMMRDTYGWEMGKTVLRRGMVQLEDGEMVEMSLEGADEDEEKGDWAPVVVET